MRNIKLTLEYDGTGFFGFQRQHQKRTVQRELERALKKLFQKRIKIIPSGRTDSGVHAEGQVVNFLANSKIQPWQIQRGLNRYLPKDISVLNVQSVPRKFHAQHSAKWKTYEYRVLNRKTRPALERFRAWQYPYALNLGKMKHAASLFVGKHDFRAFEASGGRRQSAVRTIRKLTIQKKSGFIRFTVASNGFLYKMVRSMVGSYSSVSLMFRIGGY